MSDLNRIFLGDIAKFKYGKILKKSEILEHGKYPVFSGYQIVGYLNSYEFEQEQLIIVCRGAGGTGDIKMSPHQCSITNLAIIIDIDETKFNKKYIYWVLKNSDTYSLRTGSAQPQITINSLEKFPIQIIPNIIKQKNIVNVLDGLDKKIQFNTKSIKPWNKSPKPCLKAGLSISTPCVPKSKPFQTALTLNKQSWQPCRQSAEKHPKN